MSPFFSVVIPLYNKEHFIEHTIQSVLNQSFQNFEIIIVNDGSTDASLENAKSLKDQRISIFSIKNQGVSHARNHGISKANATYIAFLDADDYWHSDFLKHIKTLTEKYVSESVFATALKIVTDKKEYVASYKGLPSRNQDLLVDYFEMSQDHSILHCSSIVIKRNVFDKVGVFDENLSTTEDTDLWIRIGLNYKIVFLNKPLSIHQVVYNSLTKTNRKLFRAIDFNRYDTYINENAFALQFIHKNKFTSAIKYKLSGDNQNFLKLKNQLNYNMLNLKQKTLLALPKSVLLLVINMYNKVSSKKNYF